jgi:hypothetical protein
LYVVEPVLMICKVAVAAVRSSCSARSYALRRPAEAVEICSNPEKLTGPVGNSSKRFDALFADY